MHFTLKVILQGDYYVSDDRHVMGGIDLRQRCAFNHLFPEGCVHFLLRDMIFEMAELHGWRVFVTAPPEPTSSTKRSDS